MTTKKPQKPGKDKDKEVTHFNRAPLRKAEFFKPLNTLRTKVGYGGLTEDVLTKAQLLLESSSVDFIPMAENYLATLMRRVDMAEKAAPDSDQEALIGQLIIPAMQLKANGGMFHYPLVTRISDKLIQFLEVVPALNDDALDIVLAFHTTIRTVLMGRISGTGGKQGDDLMQALEEACVRYFERYPDSA
jgi:hypothetical protein